MNLTEIKCKNCSAPLTGIKPVSGVIVCKHCGSTFTVPQERADSKLRHILLTGEHELYTCRFDDAYATYFKASELARTEPEAYWGMALSEFKIQYIKDQIENRLQPICHEFTDKSFLQNGNYLEALKYATAEQKKVYQSKAEEIDYICKAFHSLKHSGLDYDCFICVKVSLTENENVGVVSRRTQDAYRAEEIYDYLKSCGYKPFYSEREIKKRTGADYEAMILYALYTSETMLVVCSNDEYLRTPWINNEITRFKTLVNNKEKENDSLTIVYAGKPIERLPGENFGRIQGINYDLKEALPQIEKFVEQHTIKPRNKREELKRNSEAATAKLVELTKRFEDMDLYAISGKNAEMNALLIRAEQEMEFGNFKSAEQLYQSVLDKAPRNAHAWWGLFLVDFKVKSEKEILNSLDGKNRLDVFVSIAENKNLFRAVQYVQGDFKKRVQTFHNFVLKTMHDDNVELNEKISQLKTKKEKLESNLNNVNTSLDTMRKKAKYVGDWYAPFCIIGYILPFCGLAFIVGTIGSGIVEMLITHKDPRSPILLYGLIFAVGVFAVYIVISLLVAIIRGVKTVKYNKIDKIIKLLEADSEKMNEELEILNKVYDELDTYNNVYNKYLDKYNKKQPSMS